ncbi:MAG: LutB/LldF family L-lactate oxidation iron-sulfur protein [Actinomycetota bacterium]
MSGSHAFPEAAERELANGQLRANLRNATQTIRAKRARVVAEVPDWEELREAGRAIKQQALERLDEYLVQFEEAVTVAGGQVHWARDAAEANGIVAGIVHSHGATEAVKVKSLATDEIGLNEALAAEGIEALETDFAELILQLDGDWSSHILVPAIHRNRTEIRDLFRRTIAGPEIGDDPAELAEAARVHLRERFLRARVGISGANFGIAETGTVVVVESEGNGRMCTTLPPVLVTVMGIEKLLPRFQDLEVFLQLLPRSSTGERMNPYTSLWTGVTAGDGPEEFHVVLLDNGRTNALADEAGRSALACIRCSACLNVCPVYERTGGHAYGSVYPGPIGAILAPQLEDMAGGTVSLPYASSLCGACYEVCPVKIDIPQILVHLRSRVVRDETPRLAPEKLVLQRLAAIFADRRRYERAQRLARNGALRGMAAHLPGPLRVWAKARDMPVVPEQSFRDWWRAEHQ